MAGNRAGGLRPDKSRFWCFKKVNEISFLHYLGLRTAKILEIKIDDFIFHSSGFLHSSVLKLSKKNVHPGLFVLLVRQAIAG